MGSTDDLAAPAAPVTTTNAGTAQPVGGRGVFADTLRRLGPLGPLAAIAITFPILGGFLTLYYIDTLGGWFRSHGDIGPLIYGLGFAVLGGLALLPTYAQSALGGWAFGITVGGIAALTGFTGAALLGYAIARSAGGDRALRIIDEHPKWKAVYHALVGSGFWRALLIVTLVRLPPNSPFALTNLVMAATRVPHAAYVLGTLIGLAPRTMVAVCLAAQLKAFSLDELNRPWLFSAGIVATIGAVVIIGMIANRAVARVTATARPNGSQSV